MGDKFKSSIDGNVSILMALSISVILFVVGVAIDVTSAISTKTKMQDALDNAVLAAATYVNNLEETSNDNNDDKLKYKTYGSDVYSINLSEARMSNLTLKFEIVDGGNVMQGTASGSLSTYFGGILSKPFLDITAVSKASLYSTNSSACIIALSETATPGISINSAATILADECEMHVHSKSSNALSTGSFINVELEKTCLAATQVNDNSNGGLGELTTDCDVEPDPFLGKIPEPISSSCDYYRQSYDLSFVTMNPGVYCESHNFNNSAAEVHFNPGLYVIRGEGWNVNSKKWTGDGVTFYFYDKAKIQFNSGVQAEMSAPTSGSYKDIFITERAGQTRDEFILDDSAGFDFEGAIYLPSKHIIINSGSTVNARKMMLVGDSIAFDGALGFKNYESSALSSDTPYLLQ